MRFFLGGVNGAGKTTLLQKTKEARPEFEVVKGSQEFMAFLGIPGDYEALRALPEPYALQKLEEMVDGLVRKHEFLVFDAHYLNLVRGKVKKVTSPYLQRFDVLLLLKVSPETVLKRTANDPRERALFPEGLSEAQEFEMLSKYIAQQDEEFERLCSTYKIQGKVLDGEHTPDEVVKEFIAFADTLGR